MFIKFRASQTTVSAVTAPTLRPLSVFRKVLSSPFPHRCIPGMLAFFSLLASVMPFVDAFPALLNALFRFLPLPLPHYSNYTAVLGALLCFQVRSLSTSVMHGSLKPDILASIFITLVPACLALGLRLQARYPRTAKFWYDDYLAIFAMVEQPTPRPLRSSLAKQLNSMQIAIICYNVPWFFRKRPRSISRMFIPLTSKIVMHYGLGLHFMDVKTPPAKIEHYLLVSDIVQEMTYTYGIGSCQMSLLALYWRLFKSTHRMKMAILILAGFVIAWLLTFVSHLHAESTTCSSKC